MVRDGIRDALFKHPSTFTIFWQDPMDWGLCQLPMIQMMGSHKKFSRHNVGFLDGHSANIYADTRVYCGLGWQALNLEWVLYDPYIPRGEEYY